MTFKKKIEEIPPLKEVKKKKFLSTFRLFKFSIVFLLLCMAIYGAVSFYDTYSFQSPLILRSPIVPRHSEIIISPVSTGSAKLQSGIFDLGKIADKIYTLESSNGKNDSCRNLGKFNGYGYRQNSAEWICYDSHEEVRQLVINWLTKHIKNGDIENALCMYNQGKDLKSCTYSMNYLTLEK